MSSDHSKFLQSKWFTIALLAVIAIVYCTQITNVFDRKVDMNGDNIVYFTLAQSLHNGQGYSTIFELDEAKPHLHFPPGYPVFMAVLMTFGLDSVIGMKVVNCILLLLSIILLFFLIKKSSGNVILAAAVCLTISCHAEILRWASMMMSEQLYMLLNLILIALLAFLDGRDLFKKGDWISKLVLIASGALIAYIYLVRTMGLSMAVAAVIWAVILFIDAVVKGLKNKHVDWKHAGKYAAIAVVIIVGTLISKSSWDARNQRVSPGFRSEYANDFNKKEGGQKMSTVSDWMERINSNTQSYLTCYLQDSLFEKENPRPVQNPGAMAWCSGILIVILIIYGLLKLGRVGLLMLIYTAVTYGVLMIWPEQYSGLRYFLTLIPLLILGFFSALYFITVTLLSKSRHRNAIAVVPLLIAMIVMIPRYREAQETYAQSAKYKTWKQYPNPAVSQLAAACEWCGKYLPEGARMMCRKPELYYMLSNFHPSGRMVSYGTPEEVMQAIEKNNIQFIIIDYLYKHAYHTTFPAILKYPERFRLIQQWGKMDKNTGEVATLVFQVVK